VYTIAIVIEIKIKVIHDIEIVESMNSNAKNVTRYAKHVPDRTVLFRFVVRVTSTGGADRLCMQNRLRLVFKRKEKVIRFGLKS